LMLWQPTRTPQKPILGLWSFRVNAWSTQACFLLVGGGMREREKVGGGGWEGEGKRRQKRMNEEGSERWREWIRMNLFTMAVDVAAKVWHII
jgi:hypothetical protein